jgi:hypothetical protein
LSEEEKAELDGMSVEDFLASVKKKSVERTFSRGTSKYRGVAIAKNGKWRADISVKGKKIGLGRFGTEEEAAAAYDAALIERDGPGALTNAAFPLGFSEQALKANFRLQAQRRQEVEVKDDEEAADDDEVEGNGLPPEGWTFFNQNLMFLREEDFESHVSQSNKIHARQLFHQVDSQCLPLHRLVLSKPSVALTWQHYSKLSEFCRGGTD